MTHSKCSVTFLTAVKRQATKGRWTAAQGLEQGGRAQRSGAAAPAGGPRAHRHGRGGGLSHHGSRWLADRSQDIHLISSPLSVRTLRGGLRAQGLPSRPASRLSRTPARWASVLTYVVFIPAAGGAGNALLVPAPASAAASPPGLYRRLGAPSVRPPTRSSTRGRLPLLAAAAAACRQLPIFAPFSPPHGVQARPHTPATAWRLRKRRA